MKKVAILAVLALAGAIAGVACGGDKPAADPSGTTTTTSSGAGADSAAPAASASLPRPRSESTPLTGPIVRAGCSTYVAHPAWLFVC